MLLQDEYDLTFLFCWYMDYVSLSNDDTANFTFDLARKSKNVEEWWNKSLLFEVLGIVGLGVKIITCIYRFSV